MGGEWASVRDGWGEWGLWKWAEMARDVEAGLEMEGATTCREASGQWMGKGLPPHNQTHRLYSRWVLQDSQAGAVQRLL